MYKVNFKTNSMTLNLYKKISNLVRGEYLGELPSESLMYRTMLPFKFFSWLTFEEIPNLC